MQRRIDYDERSWRVKRSNAQRETRWEWIESVT